MVEQSRKISRTRICVAVFVLALCGAAASPALAQSTTGTVTGTVKDAQGGVVPGVTLVLTSETRGTKSNPVVTNPVGDFTFVNLAADTYSLEATMSGFKTLKRGGIAVSPGDRVPVALVIEVGGATETVSVTADAALVQSQSGERSYSVPTESITSLPLATRGFAALASLAPGVSGGGNNPARLGGGGQNNITIDGIGNVDSGNNGQLLAVNTEAIAEVKVLTSGYQAEYGRSSGLQITAVSKSGTNRFRGSVYDLERNSDWNARSQESILNNTPKTISKERDWGFSIGGPVGKPGGNNKLYFFYAHEFAPRTIGNAVTNYRLPTLLERQGDFSQSTDNNGNPYPYIKDPLLSGTCSASSQVACFADGGVLGRIPANRLYQTGLNILKMFPDPNLTNVPVGQSYNTQYIAPTEKLTAMQPVIRIDYQPTSSLRASFRYTGWRQPNTVFNGSIPGWNDSTQVYPHVYQFGGSLNYTLNDSTFLEFTYGRGSDELAGCTLGQGSTAPNFCRNGLPMNAISNSHNAGLGDLPLLFPDANVIDPAYYAYAAMNKMNPPMWDAAAGRIVRPPSFTWGSRVANAPPSVGFPGYLLDLKLDDYAVSITKVAGRHTFKAGYYHQHSYKAQQRTSSFGSINFGNSTANPLDTTFGFANAALGIFSTYSQGSKYVEGSYIYNQVEAFVQDNWRVNSRLTLDYGMRFVHQQPQYDRLLQASNFLPDKWDPAAAPALYVAACPGNAPGPCGNTRQAQNPLTGQFLGPNSAAAIATLVPGSGNALNGVFVSGQGITKTTYKWPTLALAPRVGAAFDVRGDQKVVLRGGGGLFFDRPNGNSVFGQVGNPPAQVAVTLNNAQLQTLSGLQTQGAPELNVFEYDSGGLPKSAQWNVGAQMVLPWVTTVDVAYVGQHSWDTLENVNINSIDFGAAFLPVNQDPTVTPTVLGSNTIANDQMRAFRGYGNITQNQHRGWRTFHSLQLSLNRRFANGVSFGINDTIPLSNRQSTTARLEHNPDGSYFERADQAEADKLLGSDPGSRHIMKANVVWDLPDLRAGGTAVNILRAIVNDWQLAGIWTGQTGSNYTVGFSYQNGGASPNLTGSPNYNARVRVVGDPGAGCSGDVYQQFNTGAFAGPLVGSLGLESGTDYLTGCVSSTFDLSISRNIRLGGGRSIQIRLDMFNAFNSAQITGRNTTMNLNSPSDPTTITNLPFDAAGNLIPSRSLPQGAGFGVANSYQAPRTMQAQIRFSF